MPLSASSLVVGVMCLVLGSALNPAAGGEDPSELARVVADGSGRWLGVAVMYFLASVTMTLGLPALNSVFVDRGRRLGAFSLMVFAVGVLGTAGYSMLMVFFRAAVTAGVVRPEGMEQVVDDRGLQVFILGWVVAFYLGILLLAVALLLARQTPVWSTALLVVFVAMFPISALGRMATVIQVLVLAVAFTAIAIAAVNQSQAATAAAGESSY